MGEKGSIPSPEDIILLFMITECFFVYENMLFRMGCKKPVIYQLQV